MRWILSLMICIAFTAPAAGDGSIASRLTLHATRSAAAPLHEKIKELLVEKKFARFELGRTRKGKAIEALFFPGMSDKNALVLGGVHGSELSSIEVVNTLIAELSGGDSIYYNTIIIPTLFPDNAETAVQSKIEIGSARNVGRYSFDGAIDPNRQMPTPGVAFDEGQGIDHVGRKVEEENMILLELIEAYKPQRIASVHAIHNKSFAGFFADPRTDEQGFALGYESDSALAMSMADYVHVSGGEVPGNRIGTCATTLYYKDPTPAEKGSFQKRNLTGSPVPGHKGGGISLGTWASTAVKDSIEPGNNRDAIRIITIEFPGSKRSSDYDYPTQKESCRRQVNRYANAIRVVFLQAVCVEI